MYVYKTSSESQNVAVNILNTIGVRNEQYNAGNNYRIIFTLLDGRIITWEYYNADNWSSDYAAVLATLYPAGGGVESVNGKTGTVVLTTTDIAEGTHLYYTDVRVNNNDSVAANTAARHNAVTIGTANGLSLTGQQLSLALASSTTTGSLSSTDWSTFNNKQASLGYVPENSANRNVANGYAPLNIDTKVPLANLYQSSSTQSGYLSSADWNNFNGKQTALGYTPENVANKATNLSSPDNTKYPTTLAVSNAISSIPIANTTTTGLLTATDWNTFNAKVSSQWTTTSNNIYNNNSGNVGIGTSSPVYKLDVSGTGNFSGILSSSQIGVGRSSGLMGKLDVDLQFFVRNEGSNKGCYFYAGPAVPLPSWQGVTFANDGAIDVAIQPYGGNVGMGNTSPGAKLDVSGSFKTSGLNTLSNLSGSGQRVVVADSAGNLSTTSTISVSGSKGPAIVSGNGTSTSISIPHGLGATPSYYNIAATNSAAAGFSYITANATNIVVNYTVAPAAGTNNLSYVFKAEL